MIIHILNTFVIHQCVVLLLANKKSHYNSFNMNIAFQNMYQTYLLILST